MHKTTSLLFITIFLVSLITAQTLPAAPATTPSALSNITIPTKFLSDPTPKLDDKLGAEIKLNEEAQIVARILFGIKGEISVSAFILLLAIWAWVFFLLSKILPSTPWFQGEVKRWLGALVVNLIIAITGTYVTIAKLFLDIGSYISFLEEWATGLLFFAIIVIMVFFALFQKLFKKLMEKAALEQKREQGMRGGNVLTYAEAQAEAAAEATRNLKT